MSVVLHVHSQASGEVTTIEEIAHLAQKRGIDAVILTDYLEQTVSWGIYPWHKILKVWHNRPSIKTFGFAKFENEIAAAREKVPAVLILPGVEVAPFYWWSGKFLSKDWTVHDLSKNVLIFGLDENALKGIPSIENGGPFDPYHGPLGSRPYQTVTDYVNGHGGLVVWSTPDGTHGFNFQIGPVRFNTLPDYESFLAVDGFSGVALYPEGLIQTAAVGGMWDRMLSAYCRGKKRAPVWAFAEGVIHGEQFVQNLSQWDNVVFAKKRDDASVYEAMRNGRFYIRDLRWGQIFLEDFSVSDSLDSSPRAMIGGHVVIRHSPILHVRLSVSKAQRAQTIILQILRNGEWAETQKADGGVMDILWQDPAPLQPNQKNFYRVTATTEPQTVGNLMSNPLFVTKKAIEATTS